MSCPWACHRPSWKSFLIHHQLLSLFCYVRKAVIVDRIVQLHTLHFTASSQYLKCTSSSWNFQCEHTTHCLYYKIARSMWFGKFTLLWCHSCVVLSCIWLRSGNHYWYHFQPMGICVEGFDFDLVLHAYLYYYLCACFLLLCFQQKRHEIRNCSAEVWSYLDTGYFKTREVRGSGLRALGSAGISNKLGQIGPGISENLIN